MIGFISLHRQILDWEWYTDSKMVHLFLHLVISANHFDRKWKGITIKKGQLVTSFQGLSNETGISVQSVRTLLGKLQQTGEIKVESTRFFTLVTICKYRDYQEKPDKDQHTINIQPTYDQQTTNKQLTTTNKDNKDNKEIKDIDVATSIPDLNPSLLVNDIDARKQKFKETLRPFLSTYGKDLLKNFFEYWTEPNKSNTKFKQEMEKTWDTARRLSTWAENEGKFGKKEVKPKTCLGI